MSDLLVLHGPNLNMLGVREPGVYGAETLESINAKLEQQAKAAGYSLTALQSNAEHTLIDAIHQALANNTRFIIINPAAFTHTSVALRDADRKSTRLNSSHVRISYAVFCLKKKRTNIHISSV